MRYERYRGAAVPVPKNRANRPESLNFVYEPRVVGRNRLFLRFGPKGEKNGKKDGECLGG